MPIHRKILEWQAAHPNITWIGWGIVWVIVLDAPLATEKRLEKPTPKGREGISFARDALGYCRGKSGVGDKDP